MGNGNFVADKKRFDADAVNWDAKPHRAALIRAVARALGEQIEALPSAPDLFDYGCGTGSAVLPMAGICKTLTGCDFSEGMRREFMRNAEAAGITNALVVDLDLTTDQPLPPERYDLVHCGLVLHHIADVPAMLGRFKELLRPNGSLSIADLETEDGSFHDDNSGVAHQGFDSAALCRQLEGMGFGKVSARRIHVVEKQRGGGPRHYPVFHISATL